MMIAVEEDWNWGNIAVLYDETRQHFTQTYTQLLRNDLKILKKLAILDRLLIHKSH